MTTIEVLKPGALSSFQDLGRIGHQHLGVPVSGAMDSLSHRLANWAVGNAPGLATLEVTLLGPSLRFTDAATVAWCGADLSPTLDGVPLPRAEAVTVHAGATLQFGRRRNGVRAYLAVQGGFALAEVLGSTSTYTRAGFGGYEGRALRKGDIVSLNPVPSASTMPDRPRDGALTPERQQALDFLLAASCPDDGPMRVLAGREWEQFTSDGQSALLTESWRISAQSERMGYRLEGPSLQRREPRDILSEAVSIGTIQVPPDGQPIVLMADRQTTGGYPRIAQLVTVDVSRLAQRAPGEMLRFERTNLATAHALLAEQARAWRVLSGSGPDAALT